MNTTIIEIWNGKNYSKIIQESCDVNTEVRIRIQGKKLIVKDPAVAYYQCVPIGEQVEVPVYPGCLTEDEIQQIEEQPVCTCQRCLVEETEAQKIAQKQWGLG